MKHGLLRASASPLVIRSSPLIPHMSAQYAKPAARSYLHRPEGDFLTKVHILSLRSKILITLLMGTQVKDTVLKKLARRYTWVNLCARVTGIGSKDKANLRHSALKNKNTDV